MTDSRDHGFGDRNEAVSVAAHTPGPWTVRVGKIMSTEHVWVAAMGTIIGHTIAGPVPQDILCDEDYPAKKADAALIAAAPDLLAALIVADEALRKATDGDQYCEYDTELALFAAVIAKATEPPK